jgi:hypothetical protein
MGISGSKKSSVLSIELSSLCVKLAGSNVSSFFNRSLGHRWVLLIGWSLLSQTSFTPEWRRASVCCIDIYLAAILVVWTWGFVRHAKCAKTFQEKNNQVAQSRDGYRSNPVHVGGHHMVVIVEHWVITQKPTIRTHFSEKTSIILVQ